MKKIGKVLVLTLAVSLAGTVFSGVLSFCNPTALVAEELEPVHMEIKGMTCGGCAEEVKSALTEIPEVKGADVNWKKGTADIQVKRGADREALVKAVEDAGFTVTSIK